MDTDKLKSRIREALGAAGIGREISGNIDSIIDSVAGGGGKESKSDDTEERAARVQSQQAQLRTQPSRGERDDDDEASPPRSVKAAETRNKPVQKTKRPPRKKK